MPLLSRKHPEMPPSRDRSFCHSPFWFDLRTPSSTRARLLLQTPIARFSVATLPILGFCSVGQTASAARAHLREGGARRMRQPGLCGPVVPYAARIGLGGPGAGGIRHAEGCLVLCAE